MTEQDKSAGGKFKVGDAVIITAYDGKRSDPVVIKSMWGDDNDRCAVCPKAFDCGFWNIETMEKA